MKIAFQGRLAFPDLFEAVKIGDDPTSKPRFGATGIVAPSGKCVIITDKLDGDGKVIGKERTPSTFDDVIARVAKEKWKDKAAGTLATVKEKDRVCYRKSPKRNKSGDVYSGFEEHHWIQMGNEVRPLVLDRSKSPVTAQDGKVYAGCYVNFTADVWAQDNKFGQRINATLLGVQFDKDGDAFSGGAPADADDFDDLGAGADASDDDIA